MTLHLRCDRPDGSRRYVGPYEDEVAAHTSLEAWRAHMTRYVIEVVTAADHQADIEKAQKAAAAGRTYYPNGKIERERAET